MKLNYKKAGPEDIAVIEQLAERTWKEHYISIITMEQIDYMLQKMYSAESLLQQMKEGHQFTLVYSDGIPVGYCSVCTKDNENYFLQKLYIETTLQNKGVGKQFFAYISEQLNGAKTMTLYVNRKNFKSINFYFRNGFVIKEVVDNEIGNGFFMNDFVMVKYF